MWTIPLPISTPNPTKKLPKRLFHLNLNVYRNTNHHTLNNAKIKFKESVTPLLRGLPKLDRISITYRLYVGSAREIDTSNVCSIVDKFFCDALTELGYLVDDNYKYVLGTQYIFGGIDKGNPRVEATIHPYKE